jgi:hypothetical protein
MSDTTKRPIFIFIALFLGLFSGDLVAESLPYRPGHSKRLIESQPFGLQLLNRCEKGPSLLRKLKVSRLEIGEVASSDEAPLDVSIFSLTRGCQNDCKKGQRCTQSFAPCSREGCVALRVDAEKGSCEYDIILDENSKKCSLEFWNRAKSPQDCPMTPCAAPPAGCDYDGTRVVHSGDSCYTTCGPLVCDRSDDSTDSQDGR